MNFEFVIGVCMLLISSGLIYVGGILGIVGQIAISVAAFIIYTKKVIELIRITKEGGDKKIE